MFTPPTRTRQDKTVLAGPCRRCKQAIGFLSTSKQYKFWGPGTVKTPGTPCFVLGALTDFRGPTLISVTYYRKWIRVRCRVMFSALGPGTDLNQAFRWKFWHFGAPGRFLNVFGAPGRRSGAFRLTYSTECHTMMTTNFANTWMVTKAGIEVQKACKTAHISTKKIQNFSRLCHCICLELIHLVISAAHLLNPLGSGDSPASTKNLSPPSATLQHHCLPVYIHLLVTNSLPQTNLPDSDWRVPQILFTGELDYMCIVTAIYRESQKTDCF